MRQYSSAKDLSPKKNPPKASGKPIFRISESPAHAKDSFTQLAEKVASTILDQKNSSSSKINSQGTLFDQPTLRDGEHLRQNLFSHQESFLRRFQDCQDHTQSINEDQSDINLSPSQLISPVASPSSREGEYAKVDILSRSSRVKQRSTQKHHTTSIISQEFDLYPFSNSSNNNNNYNNLPKFNSNTQAPLRKGNIRHFSQQVQPNTINLFNINSNQINSIYQTHDSSIDSPMASGSQENQRNPWPKLRSGSGKGSIQMSRFNNDLKKYTEEEGSGDPNGLLNSAALRGIDELKYDGKSSNENRKKEEIPRMSILQNVSNKLSFKLFKKINLIKKFSSTMLSFLPSRRLQKMQYRHYSIISDKAYFPTQKDLIMIDQHEGLLIPSQQAITRQKQASVHLASQTQKNISLKFQFQFSRALTKVSRRLFDCIPIFQPNNPIQIFWNIFFLSFLLVFFTLSPLLIIFEESQSQLYLNVTGPVGIVIFIMQILLILNTGFYHEGEVVKSRIMILQKYFYFYFWLDITTISCLMVATQYPELQYLKFICVARLRQMMKLLNQIEEHYQLQQKFYATYELTKLFAFVFFVAHYCGCIFYFISRMDYQNNEDQASWIKKYNVQNHKWDTLYLDSLYFSFITMVTVGFGDIVPISSNEKIYVILFSIVSCGIFGYAVNTIGSIFQELSQKHATYKLKKFEITRYMEGRSIQRTSQIKVLKYLEYMNSQEEERNFLHRGEYILSNISKNLRDEVTRDFFKRILCGSTIFANVFSNKLLDQLSLVMKEVTLGPGDVIFNKGDVDNKFYYVFKGAVEYTLEQENRMIKFGNYNVGDYFGQTGFFGDIPRTFTTKSKGNSHIVFCKREDMLRLIQENPLDLEAFSLIKDEILFKNIVPGHSCLLCQSPHHEEIKCDLVNVNSNKPLLILKENFCVDQERSFYERRDTKKYPKLNFPNDSLIRTHLKKFRADCVLEALENSEDFNILQDTRMSDKDFLLRLPKVKYNVETTMMIEETDESIYTDEDIDFFQKEESRNQQDIESAMSQITESVQNVPMTVSEKKKVRIDSRHQSTKVNITQKEEISNWNQMFRSKTRNDTFVINPPSQLGYRQFYELAPTESSIAEEDIKRSEVQHSNGGNTRSQKTYQRADSTTSIKSQHKEFYRNASKTMSHFGAAAVTSSAIVVSSTPKISETPKASGNNGGGTIASAHYILPPPLIPLRGDSQLRIERNQQSDLKEQFQNNYIMQAIPSGQQNQFDVVKEYTVYYPSNNLTQVLRSFKKHWLDKFSRKRFKTKNTFKNTQKSKVSKVSNKLTKTEIKTNKTIKSGASQA